MNYPSPNVNSHPQNAIRRPGCKLRQKYIDIYLPISLKFRKTMFLLRVSTYQLYLAYLSLFYFN